MPWFPADKIIMTDVDDPIVVSRATEYGDALVAEQAACDCPDCQARRVEQLAAAIGPPKPPRPRTRRA